MNHPTPSNAPSATLGITAIAAIATGIGISLICIIALIVLLVRAVRNHKQLLADLEERGVSIAQARGEACNSVTRPRTVLRRNTVLPFNRNSGWGTLTSVETIKSAESSGMVAHYVPPKPSDAAKKSRRLSWPFHTRRVSGHSIHLKRMKGPRLSTVLEDPKTSALVNKSHLNVSRPSLTVSYHEGRRSSSQSLLQYHPAFRNPIQDRSPAPQDRPNSGNPFFRAGANDRLQRAKSFADVPTEPLPRPPLRARSASLSDRVSGQAPDVILPPLPLDIARIKSEAKRRSQLKRIPSKQSECSVESANTSILASGASPVVPTVAKRRAQKITKPRTRGSNSVGSRPFRDSLDLRAKVLGLRLTPSNSPMRTNLPLPEVNDPYVETKSFLSEELGSKTRKDARPSRPSTMYNIPPSNASPNNVACPATPKRKLTSQTYSEGSPERQKRSTTAPRAFNGVAVRSPKRQHSQTSSRSSGGNPFQWDPSPLASAIKPSALKGSPSARQGHRRKNSVRISLVPTFHGPPTRSPSPSFLAGNVEDATEGAAVENSAAGLGLAVPASPRALPTPPSSSTFAPELKFPPTSLRASLTSTSPTLSLVGYDQPFVVLPTDQVLNELSKLERDQTSRGSVISLPQNSECPSTLKSFNTDESSEKTSPAVNGPNGYVSRRDLQMPETPYLAQIPFRPETPEDEQAQCYSSFIDLDIYDSERSNPAYQTPIISSTRAWQSGFAAIPEESSVSSQRTVDVDHERREDSPPVSPKSASPPKFNLFDRTAYNLPVYATTIPEETPDTIDPFLLSKDTFALLNSTVKDTENGLISLPNSSRSSSALVIPEKQELADSSFEPVLQAAFPFGSPTRHGHESPVLGHVQSEVSSVYSLPSPLPSLSPASSPVELPSPVMPCSPRPSHARLPMSAPSVAIDFLDMPRLAPSPQGPRQSTPRPLRTSIAALRRMNSDATNARKEKAGRGEREYLRLGREESVPLPGDESWLDDMEDDRSTQMSELEGISLAADALDEWDEGQTILDLNEGSTLDSISTITPDTESYAPLSEAEELEDTMAGAEEQESSIWDEGEKFWNSQTPPRPSSPTKPKDDFQYRVSSPLASPALSISTTDTVKPSKKRDFEVAKDSSPLPPSPTASREKGRGRKKRRESADEDAVVGASSSRYRKRSVLGAGLPNVRIQVTSPSGRIMTGTPGSLYDSQGFLRY